MTVNEAMKTYRLPNPTTPEDLECRWSKLLTFGDKVVIAGYFYNGQNKPATSGQPMNSWVMTTPAKAPSGCGRQAGLNSRMTDTQLPGQCSSKDK